MQQVVPKGFHRLNITIHSLAKHPSFRGVLFQTCTNHFTDKHAAQGQSKKPFNHKFYSAVIATCGFCGFLAGTMTSGNEKKAPSPFILEDIESELIKNFEFNPDLPAGMLLLVHEHCVSISSGVAPPSIHPLNEMCNNIIDTITKVHVIRYSDALTLAAVASIRFLGGPEVPWRYGRKKPVTKSGLEGLRRDSSLSYVLRFYSTLGLSIEETVSLMACHGLGRTGSTTYPLQWKERKFVFDNVYFQNLIHKIYEKPKYDLQDFLVAQGSSTPQIAALPYEVEMVTAEETSEIIQKFAKNADAWRETFTSAFAKLIEQPWGDDLREYIPLKNQAAIRSYTAAREKENVK